MLELRPTCEHCNIALPPRLDGGAYLLVRMHVLRDVRRRSARQRLSELRRRIFDAAGPSFEEPERRQLPGQISRRDEGQASTGRCCGAREVRGVDQKSSACEAIAPNGAFEGSDQRVCNIVRRRGDGQRRSVPCGADGSTGARSDRQGLTTNRKFRRSIACCRDAFVHGGRGLVLKIIGLIVAGALIGVLGYAATKPDTFTVQVRSRSRRRPKKSIR